MKLMRYKIIKHFLNTWVLIFVLVHLFGCNAKLKSSDDSFLEELLLANIQNTPYTAHIKITRIEKTKRFVGSGYIILKVYADVIETFRGDSYSKIQYFTFQEASSKTPAIGDEFIVSLHYSEKKDEYYIPDNGYALPATDRLRNLARSESRQFQKQK